jgi:glucose/mannose transport system substrate-binding protein
MSRTKAFALSFFLSATACSAALAAEKAEVMHWFTSPAEQKALKVYVDKFEELGGQWVDNGIAGGANARTAIVNRIVGGNPPTAAQFNTKLQFMDLIEGGLMGDIDEVAKADKWDTLFPPLLAESLKQDGKYIAVPMNVQGQNWLWYNLHVLKEAGAEPPTNYDELFTALEKVKAHGKAVPLAFQGEPVWTRYILNNTLLNLGGKKLYERIYVDLDAEAAKTPEFRKVVEAVRRLRDFTDPGAPARKWPDASHMVVNGEAAFHLMGDWAKGEFTVAGKQIGTDFGCTQLGGIYMMNTNILTFPKVSDPEQIKAQHMLARALMDPVAEVEMAIFKGSAPARLDVDPSKLDSCTREGLKRVANPQTVSLATEMLISPQLQGALEDLIVNFWNNPSMSDDDFIDRFAKTLKQ